MKKRGEIRKKMGELLRKAAEKNVRLAGRSGCLVRRRRKRPLVVVGDLHGEYESFRDFRRRFADAESLWLFLGDYVDRGPDSLGLLKGLLSFQIAEPDSVILLRGNHEDWSMNLRYGFASELAMKEMEDLVPDLENWYESLPLVAIVGEIVALHGGVPLPLPATMEDLENIRQEDPEGVQILWGDPLNGNFFPRGAVRPFDEDDLRSFLELTGCRLLVRGHQCPNGGYRLMRGNCLTLFSAVCGGDGARGALFVPVKADLKDVEDLVVSL